VYSEYSAVVFFLAAANTFPTPSSKNASNSCSVSPIPRANGSSKRSRQVLVAMLEPYKGRVFYPRCGSGGMFVQSEKFVEEHGGRVDIAVCPDRDGANRVF
jgi:N-6 DNA methylase